MTKMMLMRANCWYTGTILSLFLGSLAAPTVVHAQAGDKAVYQGSTVVRSRLYIDASVQGGADVCAKINNALLNLANGTNYPGGAAVIDARGVATTLFTCAHSPWYNLSTIKSAVILLPSGTIKISSTWTLPSGTKIVGEGGEDPALEPAGQTIGTILQAQSNFGPMIAMGSTSGCQGASVEDLVLDGNTQGNDGIDNQYCGDLSYVNHVTLYRVTGYGLYVYGNAQNSGPYSNITCDTAGSSPLGCADMKVSTLGIHGMNCTTGSVTPTANAAIYLDSSNNIIEDVRVEGFDEGIIVGEYAAASSNVLRNILGDTNKATGTQPPPVSVIEIYGTNVSDLVIMGVGNTSVAPNSSHTITDSLLAFGPYINDAYVAMYVVGKKLSTGYSRYTTSPSQANWSVGAGAISGSCNSAGSLYSNATGTPAALYVCSAVTATYKTWKVVK